MQSSRFLMTLAFAGSLGGMLTLIGTPPNLVYGAVLTEAHYQPLAFFSFFPRGNHRHRHQHHRAYAAQPDLPQQEAEWKEEENQVARRPGRMMPDCSTICIATSCRATRTSAAKDENSEPMNIVGKKLEGHQASRRNME